MSWDYIVALILAAHRHNLRRRGATPQERHAGYMARAYTAETLLRNLPPMDNTQEAYVRHWCHKFTGVRDLAALRWADEVC